jgi:hypothetical protein
VLQEIASDATRFACVFRADFAFARLGPIQPPLTADRWEAMLRAEGISWRKASGVGEFVVYYGFSATPKLVREFTEAASTWGRR